MNYFHIFTDAAVIYYANLHFTAQIITRDGRIWFYDRMKFMDLDVQPCLEHIGFIHHWLSLYRCKEGYACAAIYSRMQDWDYVESVTSMTHDSETVSRLLLCWKNLQEINTYQHLKPFTSSSAGLPLGPLSPSSLSPCSVEFLDKAANCCDSLWVISYLYANKKIRQDLYMLCSATAL